MALRTLPRGLSVFTVKEIAWQKGVIYSISCQTITTHVKVCPRLRYKYTSNHTELGSDVFAYYSYTLQVTSACIVHEFDN